MNTPIKWFEPKITLGNLLSILSMTAMLSVAYTDLRATLAQHESRIQINEREIIEIKTNIKEDLKDLKNDVKIVDGKVNQVLIDGARAKPR